MIRLIASFLVAYTTMGDAPQPTKAPPRAPVMIAQAAPLAASSLRIIAPDSVPSRSGFAIQVEAQNVKGLFWLVFPISSEAQLVRIPSFPDGEVNPLIYLGGLDSGELNFVAAGVTSDGKAIGAYKTVRVGGGPVPVPPGPTPPGPTPPGPTPPGPTPPPDPVPPTYGLEAKAKAWAVNVSDSQRAAHSQALASALQDIATKISRGEIADRNALASAFGGIAPLATGWGLLVANRWRTGFLVPLTQTTAELFPDTDESGNKVVYPMANYAQAINEVAAGLRSVQ